MTPSRALAVAEGGTELAHPAFDAEEIELIKSQIAVGATDMELRYFLQVAETTGLNPLAKQIYAIKRGDRMTIQTGIDGFRLIAQRTGQFAGRVGPFWCGPDEKWHEVWLSDDAPVAAKVGVRKIGVEEPTFAVAKFTSFAQYASNGKLFGLWKTMPEQMIAKVAEAQALRALFPQELSGLYTSDEMAQADHDAPTTTRTGKAKATPPPDVDPGFDIKPCKAIFDTLDTQRRNEFKAWLAERQLPPTPIQKWGDLWPQLTKDQLEEVFQFLIGLETEQQNETAEDVAVGEVVCPVKGCTIEGDHKHDPHVEAKAASAGDDDPERPFVG